MATGGPSRVPFREDLSFLLRPLWDNFGSILTILKPFWDDFGTILGQFKPFWDDFGNFWDYFGTILGPFEGSFQGDRGYSKGSGPLAEIIISAPS